MATVTFQITSVANGTLTKTFNVADAELARWFVAFKANNIAGQTDAQAALNWANQEINRMVGLVQTYEKSIAVVTPIVPT